MVFEEIRASSPEHVSTLDRMLSKFADMVGSYDDEYVRSRSLRGGYYVHSARSMLHVSMITRDPITLST